MWRQWLSLSAGEQKGFIILLSLCLMLLCGLIASKYIKPDSVDIELHIIEASTKGSDSTFYDADTLFVNSSTATEMARFGLSDRFIVNALKYRDAGGHYRDFNDLTKTRGYDSTVFSGRHHLLVFDNSGGVAYSKHRYEKRPESRKVVHLWFSTVDEMNAAGLNLRYADSILSFRNRFFLTGTIKPDSVNSIGIDGFMALLTSRIKGEKRPPSTKEKRVVEPFDINIADTTMLMQLDGVNRFAALRILEYRNRLGGFVDIRQLTESGVLSSELLNKNENVIFADKTKVKTMSLNTSGVDKLRKHPYISFYLAKEIVERRKAKGDFTAVEQIKGLPSFDAASPFLIEYLTLDKK